MPTINFKHPDKYPDTYFQMLDRVTEQGTFVIPVNDKSALLALKADIWRFKQSCLQHLPLDEPARRQADDLIISMRKGSLVLSNQLTSPSTELLANALSLDNTKTAEEAAEELYQAEMRRFNGR